MKLIKNNIVSISILILAIMGEYLHTLFTGVHSIGQHSNGKLYQIYNSDMVYYFINELFVLYLLVILTFKAKSKFSKMLLLGSMVWFTIEFLEISLMLFKISDARLYVNDGSWIQLSTCFFTTLFAYYGHTRFKS